MTRRKNDDYPTPDESAEFIVGRLLKHVKYCNTDSVLEPCSGGGNLLRALKSFFVNVAANDINKDYDVDYHLDVTLPTAWETLNGTHAPFQGGGNEFDWIITNPPFKQAQKILECIFAGGYGQKGVAFLLGINFLEPCKKRRQFLFDNPPNKVIVLPRISFTGDGKTAPLACAWFVWDDDSHTSTNLSIEW